MTKKYYHEIFYGSIFSFKIEKYRKKEGKCKSIAK